MFNFPDFGQLGQAVETMETGIRDINSRMEAVETHLRTLVLLNALALTDGDFDAATTLVRKAREWDRNRSMIIEPIHEGMEP